MWLSDLVTRFSNAMFRKKLKATFYMKSGNVIELLVYELDVTKDGCQVTALQWELAGDELVMNINVDQIEAIILKK